MTEFKFTINGEEHMFIAPFDDNNKLRRIFNKQFPTYKLHEDYCMCYDRCYCENGHYVSAKKWISKDPQKPWEGETVSFYVPLYVMSYRNDKNARIKEWHEYFDNSLF